MEGAISMVSGLIPMCNWDYRWIFQNGQPSSVDSFHMSEEARVLLTFTARASGSAVIRLPNPMRIPPGTYEILDTGLVADDPSQMDGETAGNNWF
jgi:hypothetical protein